MVAWNGDSFEPSKEAATESFDPTEWCTCEKCAKIGHKKCGCCQ